jgi:hypothetical protein
MKKIIVLIILCILSFTEVNAQDFFSRTKAIARRGVSTNIPVLSNGEFYWATDTETLYMGASDGTARAYFAEQPALKTVNTDTAASLILLDCSVLNKFYIPYVGEVDIGFSNLPEGKWITVIVDNIQSGYGQPTFSSATFSIDQLPMGDETISLYSFIKINSIIYGSASNNFPAP